MFNCKNISRACRRTLDMSTNNQIQVCYFANATSFFCRLVPENSSLP